jgi:hypothetical protein
MSLIISQVKVCVMGLGVLCHWDKCHSTYVNQICSITKVDVTWVVINLYVTGVCVNLAYFIEFYVI